MTDQQRFLNEDLVLKVSPTVDPTIFDTVKYEPFLDALCGSRDYQKDAIRTTLRYLLGGRYPNLRSLAEENFNTNDKLKERYSSFKEFERNLQISDALACSLDLATGTGKSYVMYGIARILLACGAVDRVLVLAPSTTIESSLQAKFKEFSSDPAFKDLLPLDSVVRTPHVIDATESIIEGSICVENYHAVLGHVKSSIRDSLEGKGERTLVLNDEVHHVYNANSSNDKRWKEFLLDPAFKFRYIVGFSGTCYIKDDYFTDVISRYSLREAMEAGFVKSFEYVAEESSGSQNEKFQKMHDNHSENKTRYRKVKPLTILVSKDITSCKKLTEDLISFLSIQEAMPPSEAAKKVLIVTSSPEHSRNLAELPFVDRRNSPIEWITSVSMLTEGWDVKNVFQIVPHEERAFNSKLLIAQVLGRGLRVPEEYKGERPIVTILNHDKWSKGIKHLVDEVLEIEKRIYSYPVIKNSDPEKDLNFAIHHISYERLIESEDIESANQPEFIKGYIPLISQETTLVRKTEYIRVDTQQKRMKQTLVRYKMYHVDEVAEQIHNRLKSIDMELGDTSFSEQYNFEWLKELIKASLRRINETDDLVSEDNRQRLYRAFGSIHLQVNRVPRFRFSPTYLYKVDTTMRPKNSTGFAAIRRGDVTVFWDEDSQKLSDDETRSNLADLVKDTFLERLSVRIENSFSFKTPLNLVIADHDPEYKFLRALTQTENAKVIDAWIKSTDHDFYSIEFGWRKNDYPTRGNFNPDFFIKVGNHILVAEIKDDDQISHPSRENQEKWKAARKHFQLLNELQHEVSYSFNFLAPRDYDLFFTKLRQFSRKGSFSFESSLDVSLGAATDE